MGRRVLVRVLLKGLSLRPANLEARLPDKAETSRQRREAIFQHTEKKTNTELVFYLFVKHVYWFDRFLLMQWHTFHVGKEGRWGKRWSGRKKERSRAALRRERRCKKLKRGWEEHSSIWRNAVAYDGLSGSGCDPTTWDSCVQMLGQITKWRIQEMKKAQEHGATAPNTLDLTGPSLTPFTQVVGKGRLTGNGRNSPTFHDLSSWPFSSGLAGNRSHGGSRDWCWRKAHTEYPLLWATLAQGQSSQGRPNRRWRDGVRGPWYRPCTSLWASTKWWYSDNSELKGSSLLLFYSS